jgi:hypothetical protein
MPTPQLHQNNQIFQIPKFSNYLGYVHLTDSHISCIPVVAPELHQWLLHMVGIHVIIRYNIWPITVLAQNCHWE